MTTTTPQQLGRQETLSEWAGPYVTQMLGKAAALSNMPYQTYQGPMTAGPSALQTQAFQGIGGLGGAPTGMEQAATTAGEIASGAGQPSFTPGTFGNAFQGPGAYAPGQFGSTFQAPSAYQPTGGSFTDTGIASQYMNPFMQQVLAPQMQALQRQADIQRTMAGAQAAKQGAFGGARSGLMNQQINAELMRQQQQTTGQAYQNAFTQAQQQYNTEMARRAQEAQFGAQQGMTAADLAARYGLSAQQAGEASRQFGAQQAMQGAQLGAQYGLAGQQAEEASRQFGARYGLEGLAQRLAAAQAQSQMAGAAGAERRANLASMLGAGQLQRDIQQQGIAADLAEFERQRDWPYKQLQFQQSMLQGMPIASIAAQYQQPSSVANVMNLMGGLMSLYDRLPK